MSAAHTPAPWTIGGPTEFINQLRIDPCICVVYGAGDELRANACLIAAAPDLLAVLADLLEAADSMAGTYGCIRGDTPEDSDTHIHDEWAEGFLKERAEAARAAISKATGGAL